MATYTKFYDFVQQLAQGTHNLSSGGSTCKVYLSNTLPTSGMTTKGDCAEITATMGYTAGGGDIDNSTSLGTGTLTLTGVDVVFTASGGSFGPFRYAIVYNDTATDDNLICWWDYGTSISCLDTETFTVNFGASVLTIE